MKKKPTKKTQADGVRGTLWYFEPHEIDDDHEMAHAKCCDALADIRTILAFSANSERKTNRELHPEEFGA